MTIATPGQDPQTLEDALEHVKLRDEQAREAVPGRGGEVAAVDGQPGTTDEGTPPPAPAEPPAFAPYIPEEHHSEIAKLPPELQAILADRLEIKATLTQRTQEFADERAAWGRDEEKIRNWNDLENDAEAFAVLDQFWKGRKAGSTPPGTPAGAPQADWDSFDFETATSQEIRDFLRPQIEAAKEQGYEQAVQYLEQRVLKPAQERQSTAQVLLGYQREHAIPNEAFDAAVGEAMEHAERVYGIPRTEWPADKALEILKPFTKQFEKNGHTPPVPPTADGQPSPPPSGAPSGGTPQTASLAGGGGRVAPAPPRAAPGQAPEGGDRIGMLLETLRNRTGQQYTRADLEAAARRGR